MNRVSLSGLVLVSVLGAQGCSPPVPTADASRDDALVSDGAFTEDVGDLATDATSDALGDTSMDVGSMGNGFEFVDRSPAMCPLSPALCASEWPTTGAVERWRSRERFGAVMHDRTAWHYRPPASGTQPLPLVIFLHGGNGNGPKLFSRTFDELARGEEVAWRRNTATCAFEYGRMFRDRTGGVCVPPAVRYRGAEPFALLFPDGILSRSTPIPDARHWEDGRTPSPGQLQDAESRDDVGFIAHLIAQASTRADVDPERIYLVGWSNGGMMTQRVLCALDEPGREPLRRIAAVSVGIAAMPANLYDGAMGRMRCPRVSMFMPPVMFSLGRGIPTADCERYPCTQPVTDGDGIMPYAVMGERHRVNSPDQGMVVSVADSLGVFRAAMTAAYGAPMPETQSMLGTFTELRTLTFGVGTVALHTMVTVGGAHEAASSRADFAPEPRQWAFLAGYRRRMGAIERRVGAAVTGEY
ncbi:MAG: hypothetical protein Q8Q09_01540 [Deltaproteobacteria bacterium]|nr:hypothetical protein [Deltaproteobacteria bacterium]